MVTKLIGIQHKTSYRYRRSVGLGAHRLMLRPRESQDLRLVGFDLTTEPEATLTWAQDVYGNAVATATFAAPTTGLVIDCRTEIELSASAWPVFDIAAAAISFPFRYPDDAWTDLGPLSACQYPDPAARLAAWAQGFVAGHPTDTLSLLKDLNAGVSAQISYEIREDEGTQSPLRTLERGMGSCRDFAVLFAEAVRSLGFGARIVSGYLHNPDQALVGSQGNGSTHAWAEVYVPGAGWITFDPTNLAVGGANLIPVAVARDIHQAMPVTGSFTGPGQDYDAMTVDVRVSELSGENKY
ncbi:transglutaminase domain-containing protein [Amorphus sp. 3PC139-8]|uniref:transglutaminase family protein n=1 Tax=Amorphus sp. 3PC139-8 TaxID=2735676 RepID=UPI00345CD82C